MPSFQNEMILAFFLWGSGQRECKLQTDTNKNQILKINNKSTLANLRKSLNIPLTWTQTYLALAKWTHLALVCTHMYTTIPVVSYPSKNHLWDGLTWPQYVWEKVAGGGGNLVPPVCAHIHRLHWLGSSTDSWFDRGFHTSPIIRSAEIKYHHQNAW